MKLVGVGDNVVDFYEDLGTMFPGGNALNVAVFCRRHNAEKSSYIGVVGNDIAGKHVLDSLKKERIDVSKVRKAFGNNGEAVVSLNEQNDRVFVRSNKKFSIQSQLKINFNEADIEFIKNHTLLHTSVYSFIEDDLPLLSKLIPISFDFSTQHNYNYLARVCPYLKFAFFSGGNLSKGQLSELIDVAHKFGVENVCITRGENGSLFSNRNKLYTQQAVKIKTVDTLGAGDSFISKFLTEYYNGNEIQSSLQSAAEAAAETCKNFGAFGYGLKKSVVTNN